MYQVTKGLDGWDIEEGRFTEISTDHLYIYEGVLDENKAANMAGSVLNSTYQSDLGSKFTLSYTEPSMLKKHGWIPALPMMRNRNTDYQNSKGYLTSQIRRRSAKKITDIVALGNGCIYLNDSLKGLQADSLAHLRVLLINPPFPITRFAARFEKAGLKYKNYGFVSSLGDFGSKVKGLGMNSPLGDFQMNRKYLEKKETIDKQREETIKTIYPLVAAIRNVSVKATFDAGATFFGGGPVLLCYSALLSYWTKNDRAQNPLMSSNDIRSKVTNKLIIKTKNSAKNAIENHKNKRL